MIAIKEETRAKAGPEPKVATPEQQQAISEIRDFQESTGLSDEKFAAYLPCSGSTWGRIKGGIYAGDLDGLVPEIKRAASAFRAEWMKTRHKAPKHFFEFADFEALFAAVSKAVSLGEAGEENKLVWFVADTGWGKDAAIGEIVRRFGALALTARQSWRRSYMSAVKQMAQKVGVRAKLTSTAAAESALIRALTAAPRPVLFNEMEFFGVEILNLLKTILNETPCPVICFCVPKYYSKIGELGGTYSEQLQRRTEAVIRSSAISPAMARRFLEPWFPGATAADLKGAAVALSKGANGFGGYDRCRRVAAMLAAEFHGSGEVPGEEATAKAVARCEALTRVGDEGGNF